MCEICIAKNLAYSVNKQFEILSQDIPKEDWNWIDMSGEKYPSIKFDELIFSCETNTTKGLVNMRYYCRECFKYYDIISTIISRVSRELHIYL